MSKYLRFVGLALVVMMLMSLTLGVSAQEKVVTFQFGPGDIPSLDPALATDTSSIQVIQEIFPGLSRLHEVTLELQPGMADWSLSDDGLVYTFNLLQGVPWVKYNADSGAVEEVMDADGNVRYVTAADFVYGWQRTLDPATAGDYAYVLAPWVAGGSAYNSGEGMVDDLGIVALDDYTLQVTASEPAGFLANIFGMWMAAAQPSWAIEEYGDFWTEPENIVSYGPFALSEWLHEESATIVKNPFWVGTEAIPASTLDAVQFLFLEESAGFANFEAGLIDVTAAPLADLDRIKADATLSEQLSVGPGGCTYYYGYNLAKPPFDDARVRRAFSMAMDRQSLIDNVLKGGQEPAFFFSRPNFSASPTAEMYPQYVIGEDLDVARAELQSYLDEKGITIDQLPPITLMHNESEAHARIAQAIQQMWAENLGVEVQIATQEWAVYLQTLREDAPQVWRLGWCLDYPDPHNFLWDVFHTSTNPRGNWSNAEFDALVDEAKVLIDNDTRRELYAQAENILSNTEAGIIPIYFYTSLAMTNPRIERTYSQLGGTQYFEKWDIKG